MSTSDGQQSRKTSGPTNDRGWDGKLRLERRAVIANPEALTDPEHSDEDAPPVEQIAADDGKTCPENRQSRLRLTCPLCRSVR